MIKWRIDGIEYFCYNGTNLPKIVQQQQEIIVHCIIIIRNQ